MVLWEITLGTAYFLGLKRTYKLALRIQHRLISRKHPKIRQFLQRRTRNVFDVALKVHENVQQRDIEVGRNFGNWILRWLDRMKPAAQIRGPPTPLKLENGASSIMNRTKQVTSASNLNIPRSFQASRNQESDRHLFTSARNMWPKPFPSIAMMMRPPRPAGTMTRISGPEILRSHCKIGAVNGFRGVIRKDIMLYILQN